MCLVSLIIREIQIKITMRYHLLRWLFEKKKKARWQMLVRCEEKDNLEGAGENVHSAATVENNLEVHLKIKNRSII
jgi:hypothetical protein